MDSGPILICYDGSEEAAHAIDVAATLLKGRESVVLDVAPNLTPAESFASTISIVPSTAFEQLNASQARPVAEAGADRIRSAGLSATARTEVESPVWQAICDVADEIDACVIVVGARRLTALRAALAGRTSRDVAEHAGRPVLVVPGDRSSS